MGYELAGCDRSGASRSLSITALGTSRRQPLRGSIGTAPSATNVKGWSARHIRIAPNL
jgi:hypothetical protein